MNGIDDNIPEAHCHKDDELMAHLQRDFSLLEMLMATFRGRHRWLSAMAFAWIFVALALAILAAYQFFQAESPKAMIAWATAFLWFNLWIVMLKIWFWMEMQRFPITRDIMRLERKITELSRQLEQRQETP